MKKRIISLLCAVLMLTALCVPAFAAASEIYNDTAEDAGVIARKPEYAYPKTRTEMWVKKPYTVITNEIKCYVSPGDTLYVSSYYYDVYGSLWAYCRVYDSPNGTEG